MIKFKCKCFYKLVFTLLIITHPSFAQEDSEVEFFIIDSFVTPEKPYTFKLVFFTDKEVKAKIEIDSKYTIDISNEFKEDHSANIDFSQYQFDKKNIPYQIIAVDKNGKTHFSEMHELILPYEEFIETEEGSEPISTLIFGMLLYLLPSPNFVIDESGNYFSLTKELPIITFYASGYNYPSANISLEYSHIYNGEMNNILRLGYKQIYPVDVIEYISPGLSMFTNFKGFNGLGAELSIGLFKVYDVFTVYTRYRYNAQPTKLDNYFHEVSIGLFSHFFTIDF